MLCKKCGGTINSIGKCLACGFDNSNFKYEQKDIYMQPSNLRSTRLTIFIYLVLLLDIISAIMGFFSFFNISDTPELIVKIFAMGLIFFEIILCLFILRLKKWAVITYIAISIISSLLVGDIVILIIKALFMYFIFSKNWEDFE